jgi:hypothetical protein
MVSTLDLAGGCALVRWDNQGTALRLVAAETFTQWCIDATASEVDESVARASDATLAYGLDWYDMLGMFSGPQGGT